MSKYAWGIPFAVALAVSSSMAMADETVGVLPVVQHLHLGQPRGTPDPVVYDATGASFTTTTGVPRTHLGGAANISGAGPEVDVTSIDVFMASTTGATYTNVRARVQLWDTYSETSTPIFAAAAGALIEADTGPVTTTTNTVSTITIDLPTPVRLGSLTGKGFAVNFQSDTGAGLADDPALTTALSINGAQPVGTSAVAGGNGFFRNVSGRTDFNFNSTDLRTFTGITDTRTSIVIRGNSSVPVTLQSFQVD